jgi:hypothetical protein
MSHRSVATIADGGQIGTVGALAWKNQWTDPNIEQYSIET